MDNYKDNKKAFITGASSGIGAEFARQLACDGYHVALVARRKERLHDLAGELQENYGVGVDVLVADLTQDDDLQRLETYISQLQFLDLLVNNAGFGMRGKFIENDISKHITMIQVHDIASVRLSWAALSGMLARDQGGIINVSSVSALVPIGNITYGSTKAFQVVFSETLQKELYGTGIHIQALCPGYTYTEFHDRQDLEGFQHSRVPKALWTSTEQVVSESLTGLTKGKVVVIPGRINRMYARLGRISILTNLIRYIARQLRSKRYDRS